MDGASVPEHHVFRLAAGCVFLTLVLGCLWGLQPLGVQPRSVPPAVTP